MAVDDKFKIEIDAHEKEIEEILLKLEITGFYNELADSIKEKYAELQSKYYGERLDVFNEYKEGLRADFNISNTSRYAVDIETDVLTPLKEIMTLANCKQLVVSLDNSENIDIDEINKLIEKYGTVSPKYNAEKTALYDEIGALLYKLIKQEGIKNRFNIIDLLYEYKEKDINFIVKVSRLFLEEVNEIFKKAKEDSDEIFKSQNGRAIIELVKHATDDDFSKEDIINLLVATGKITKPSIVETKDTQVFDEAKQYTTSFYTNRIPIILRGKVLAAYNVFRKATNVDPFPTNSKANMKLREYDMTRVNLGVKYSKLEGFYKCVKPRLEKTDYSYTNAVIIPKYYRIKSLRNANLEGVDMRGVDLTDIDITGANLLGTGADITGSIGECLGVSAYEPKRVLVSKKMITPMQFEKITGLKAIAPYNQKYVNEYFPWENRVLRQYDLSCINYNEYINQIYEENEDKQFKGLVEYVDSMYCRGLDFSYTNIDIDPQQFTEQLVLNLEGVDLRDKDFRGKEKLFAYCNLKGTGANISPRINPTVSEYIVPTKERKK